MISDGLGPAARPHPLRRRVHRVGPRLPSARARDGDRLHADEGLPAPDLAVIGTGMLIVVAGVMIVIGFWVDLAALAIFFFLLGTAFLFHDFWTIEDPQERLLDSVHFQKDLALAGG